MDSVTQIVLGASIQGAMLGRWQGRKALIYGAALGTVPDLDVLIDYGDAVADMTYHRGFSHSLFVLATLAALLTWLIRKRWPDAGYSSGRLFATLALVLCTHPLLDSFTTYGTQLFWPLPMPPVAISSIFIIDPLYTLPLLLAMLAGLVIGLGRSGLRWQYAGLLLSSLYLGSTLIGKQMADHHLQAALAQQGIQPQATFSTPTPFNTLLWRVMAVDGDNYYEGLVGWLDHEPLNLIKLPTRASEARQALLESPQDQRLRWFTGDRLRYDLIDGQWVATDLRLGMSGYHPFRFALATVDPATGETALISEVEQWPQRRPDAAALRLMAERALDARTPLSIAELSRSLTEPAPHQQR
mgnify:FL=1|tara:strand:- start:1307 stop:2374 length:1068 start_codon:yes stop_codon:yes gene_type:complete